MVSLWLVVAGAVCITFTGNIADMIYKLLIAGIGLAVSYVVARKLAETQDKARVKVRTEDRTAMKSRRLRQDPETGVYYPED